MDEEIYTIPKDNLVVTALYDDGTSTVLEERGFTIAPEYADGSSDSYTGTVTYQENGTERTSSFQFGVNYLGGWGYGYVMNKTYGLASDFCLK